MMILSDEKLLLLHNASLSAGLAARRNELLVGIGPQVLSPTQSQSTPADQLLADLRALNQCRILAGGSVPLKQWLGNAIKLTDGHPDQSAFRSALEAVNQTLFSDNSEEFSEQLNMARHELEAVQAFESSHRFSPSLGATLGLAALILIALTTLLVSLSWGRLSSPATWLPFLMLPVVLWLILTLWLLTARSELQGRISEAILRAEMVRREISSLIERQERRAAPRRGRSQ